MLGALGPYLDAGTYADYGYTPDQQGEHRRLELEAQRACAQATGAENGGYIRLADGAVVCTDKHGRKPRRNQITIATKVEAP